AGLHSFPTRRSSEAKMTAKDRHPATPVPSQCAQRRLLQGPVGNLEGPEGQSPRCPLELLARSSSDVAERHDTSLPVTRHPNRETFWAPCLGRFPFDGDSHRTVHMQPKCLCSPACTSPGSTRSEEHTSEL